LSAVVIVRLLGGSFGFFSFGLCGGKKYKCASKSGGLKFFFNQSCPKRFV